MLQVLSAGEKLEVHRLVLEMMKAVAVTEANTGVLNLKTTRRSSSPSGPGCSPSTSISPVAVPHNLCTSNGIFRRSNLSPRLDGGDREASPESHPFREYMDNPGGADLSVSDSEEIMAYVNMKVSLGLVYINEGLSRSKSRSMHGNKGYARPCHGLRQHES